jgi:hypothetical protein
MVMTFKLQNLFIFSEISDSSVLPQWWHWLGLKTRAGAGARRDHVAT